jgi:hypothetical protein
MTAIITNNLRKKSCSSFLNDFILNSSENDLFIGLGKSDKWADVGSLSEDQSNFPVPLPQNVDLDNQNALDNLISLVRVSNASTLVPRNKWKSGRVYKAYDSSDPLTFDLEGNSYPCYMTVNNKTYICLENNSDASSTIPPDLTYSTFDTSDHVHVGSDGYIWAYLQTNLIESPFYSNEFNPVVDDLSDTTASKSATGGLLHRLKVVNGGSGLVGTENIYLNYVTEGNVAETRIELRSDSRFSVVFSGGSISSIQYNDIKADAILNVRKASIEVFNSSNTTRVFDVEINPLIAPANGYGASVKNDLPAFYAGFHSKFQSSVDGETLVDTPFRQVSLIRNPERNTTTATAGDSGSVYSDTEAMDACDYIQVNSIAQDYPAGSIISQEGSLARAYLDKTELGTNRLHFHRNSNTEVNYTPFNTSDNVTITSTDLVTSETINGTDVLAIVDAEYIHGSGEVMFIDNRKRITRNWDQTEDVKIVIQF